MIPITTSENFIYGVNPSLLFFGGPIGDAFARVMALAATCEADFQTLRNLFAVPGGFGPSNRVSVSIDPTIGAKSLEGWNNGYHSGDGKSEIQIVPFPGDPNGDAAARAVFVAEMSEIFMTYRNKLMGKTWIINYSDGEALSTI